MLGCIVVAILLKTLEILINLLAYYGNIIIKFLHIER